MRPIGVFDSGVGGLGILKLASQRLPNYDFVYVADNANLPFGQKTVEQLHTITEKIVNFLIQKHNVQLVVVACNTATVTSIDHLRKQFSIPIVGAVPVVKPACEKTKNKRVAIMATTATVSSTYLKDLTSKHANGAQVLAIPCPGLAELVDRGDLSSPEVTNLLKQYLSPAIAHNADIIALGCTQYPFLREQIQQLIPPNITILDSNEPVALQVERVIKKQPALGFESDHVPTYTFYATKEANTFSIVARTLIGSMVQESLYIEI